MWCVLKCRAGMADEVMASCKSRISNDILRDIFIFTYDRMKRYEGSWHTETKEMFPGYVFMETGNISALEEQLKPYAGFVDLLGDRSMLRRVDPEEERFLRSLCGQEHHLGMSRGYIRDGITHIVNGPLVGQERRIHRIDRHKRIANIWISDAAPKRLVAAGLEITSKS